MADATVVVDVGVGRHDAERAGLANRRAIFIVPRHGRSMMQWDDVGAREKCRKEPKEEVQKARGAFAAAIP